VEKYQEIINLFQKISKYTEDTNFSEKEIEITNWLKENKIAYQYFPGIGLVINPIENPSNILVSHIDLIPKFQKGYKEGKTFKETEKYIKGALDNTLTNAIALIAIKELLKEGHNKTELILSEYEETTSLGIENYLKYFKERVKNAVFINLDITNEGFGKDASIEFDKPNFESIQILKETLSEYKIHYTHNREFDDADKILEFDKIVYTHGLPTKDNIHSFKNKALKEKIVPYLDSVKEVLKTFFLPSEKNEIPGYLLNKALEHDTYNEFKKETEKINERREIEWQNVSREEYEEDYVYSLMFSFFINDLYIEDIEKVKTFLNYHYLKGMPFNEENLKKLGLKKEEIKDNISFLKDEGIIAEFGKGEWIFNPEYNY
jgi:hypothetical protein